MGKPEQPEMRQLIKESLGIRSSRKLQLWCSSEISWFPSVSSHQQSVSEPFRTVGAEGTYDVFARINGGGTSGQAGALRLGVARALNEIDVDANRPSLKKIGFLTRDARVIERKKYGFPQERGRG